MEPINDHLYNARRILILGVSGMGKTELACRFIATHPADLVLIYDWEGGQFARRIGCPLAFSRSELIEKIEKGYRIIAYDAEAGESDPQGTGFEWFCEMSLEVGGHTAGRKLIVADEIQSLISPYEIPESVKTLLTRGRRRRIDTLMVGSAANALHNTNRDQVTEVICFRTLDENSLKYPKSLGIDIDRVKELPKHHFIHKDLSTGLTKELALWGKKSKPVLKVETPKIPTTPKIES